MSRAFNPPKSSPTLLSTLSRTSDDFPPRQPPARRTRRRSYCKTNFFGIPLWFFWTLLSVAILALVIPLAIMFGRKKRHNGAPTVLMPLYIYPSPGAWDPLFTAVEKYPKLNFTVVINPGSGPEGLDGNYTRDIPRLNGYGNVRTVGYVSTNYTNRDISLVQDDIKTYASWSTNASMSGMGMRGIFLDEAPSDWSDARGQFYATLASVIRSETGLGTDPLIIHNPGTIPSSRYLTSNSSNLTVIFENTYSAYNSTDFRKSSRALQRSANIGKEAFAAVIYDVPDVIGTSGGKRESVVDGLTKSVGSLYLTGSGVGGDVYAGFWNRWGDWVGEVGG